MSCTGRQRLAKPPHESGKTDVRHAWHSKSLKLQTVKDAQTACSLKVPQHLVMYSWRMYLHGILDLLVLEAMRQQGVIRFCDVIHRCSGASLSHPAS